MDGNRYAMDGNRYAMDGMNTVVEVDIPVTIGMIIKKHALTLAAGGRTVVMDQSVAVLLMANQSAHLMVVTHLHSPSAEVPY
jgi:hypothetical protein